MRVYVCVCVRVKDRARRRVSETVTEREKRTEILKPIYVEKGELPLVSATLPPCEPDHNVAYTRVLRPTQQTCCVSSDCTKSSTVETVLALLSPVHI